MMKGVRRPDPPASRDRVYSDIELERLYWALGDNLDTVTGRVGATVRLAVETAMRAGELCSLEWERIDLEAQVATLPMISSPRSFRQGQNTKTIYLCHRYTHN